jgi:hypothetical protein
VSSSFRDAPFLLLLALAAVLGVVAILTGGQGVVFTAGEVGIWGTEAYGIHRHYAFLPITSCPESSGIEGCVDAKSR